MVRAVPAMRGLSSLSFDLDVAARSDNVTFITGLGEQTMAKGELSDPAWGYITKALERAAAFARSYTSGPGLRLGFPESIRS